MWKGFLVDVHQLAIPTDQHKYHLTSAENEALKKQKNDRGKRKKEPTRKHSFAQDSDEDKQNSPAVQGNETVYDRFSRLYPGLSEMHEIWSAYNSAEIKFNLMDEAVCEVIRRAWSDTCSRDRNGPPNDVLRKARTQRAKDGKCDATSAFRIWQILSRTGSKIMLNKLWSKPTNKLLEDDPRRNDLLDRRGAAGRTPFTPSSTAETTSFFSLGKLLSWPEVIAQMRARSKEETAELRRKAQKALPNFKFKKCVLDTDSEDEA